MLGQQRACALILTGAGILNIVLNVLLIPVLELAGAAIATSASFVALALSVFYVARRRLGISMFPTVPWSTLARVFPKLAGTHRT